MLCLPLLLGLAAPTAAQTHRNLDIQVADAYEGENIIVTLTLSSAPGSVSAAQRTFTVSTEVPTAGAVNTCIASHGCTAGSTPAAATDFTALASTNTVVFGANETVKTISIATATDNLSEGLEVVRINIDYNPGVSDLGIFTASTTQSTGSEFTGRNAFDFTPSVFPTTVLIESYGTISDGTRPAPEISIAPGTSPVTEGTAASFTVTATPAPRSQSVNLTVTQSGSFVASGDLGSSKTVTIGTSGEATYTVPTQDDSTDEPNGSVTVTVNSGTGYTVASAPNNAATVVVEDDDTAPTNVYVDTPTGKIAEGTTVNFFVGVTQAPATDLTVNYTLGGTATAGTDYTIAGGSPNYSAGTGTFTIPSGTTAFASYVPLTLTGIADNTPDAGETVVITIEAGNDYGLGRGTSTTYTIVEDGGVATFAVSGKPRVGETLTINRTVDDPDGNGTVSNYHWEKRNPGGEWSIIFQTGSTEHLVNSKTYVVRAEDLGMELRGQITYNDDTDLPTTVHTSPVGPIEPASADAPQLVSIKRHEQAFNHPRWAPGLLCPALVWEVKFDKPMPPVHASDFTLTGSSAGLDIFSNLSDFSIVYVVAKCGGLETVSGTVTLNVASNHNIRDFEGRRLASTTPTETNDNTFTLNPNETLVYFTQENYYVDEGDEAVVTLRLSRLRDTATTISALSATPLTATGNGVDYHGQTYSVTIPAYRASGTLRIRTSNDTLTEEKETFRVDIHGPLLPAGVAVTTAPGATGNDGQTYIHIRDEDTATAKANKEPGLVFDTTHLTWNEADGCGNTGPTYNVKLKTEPLGPVEVFIEDPDDNYRSDYVAKGRLSIDNTPPSAGEQGGAYEIHDDGTYSTHPLPKLDEHTVLHFTPGNWDTYQLVNVKVRCSDHYTAQIPIKHRLYTNYIGDKGKLSHAYPGYSGVVDKGWTVHVYIRESDPPIVVEHLPAPGQTVEVKEGSHLDFEITLSEAAFKHDSTLTVYLSARGGKAAGVKRRDGDAQSCGGPLDDCLIFTPSNRTQWVRLFAIGPGRDELKVEIPQLRWGGLEHVRDWEMRWPVEVEHAGICGRTKAVRDALVGRIGGVSHCRDVTPEHLAGIGGTLNLQQRNLSSLQVGDFNGLTALNRLDLDKNQLTSLPAGIFDQLTSLTWLELYNNSSLAPLPAGIFDQLTKLEYLDMDNIGLTTLPAGIFDQHQELNTLWLRNNRLEALPENIFHKTRKLHTLRLQNNPGAPFRPTADAGPDQTVSTGAQVTLSSTATGPWGDNLRFRWWQVDGPNSDTIVTTGVTLSSATSTAPTFTAPAAPTVLHFRLSAEPVVFGTLNLAGLGNSFAWVTITVGGGQGSPQQDALAAQDETPSCVSDALLADALLAASETWRTSPGHVERWSRVLAAFGESNAWSNNPMTVAEAQAQADRGLKRWALVPPALECLAAAPEEQPEQAEVQPVTPATPELSLSAGSAVDEGGNATFTVTADPAPQSDLTIAWTVAQSGEYLAAPGAGSRTVTLTAGTTSTDLSVATVDDAADEADGSVSVTLGTGTGYTVATGKGSAAVAVRDNDEPTVSIAAGSGVTEGTSASFTVSASPVPAAPLDVTLTVAQSGDFATSGETGSRTVTVPVSGSVDVEVATVDDGADEPDGSVTASVDAGTGYTVAAAPDNAATVAVSDNDAASSGPTLSIADASFKEDQGTVHFTVTLSEPVDHRVTVHYATRSSSPISARAGQDYFEWKRAWGAELWIPAGSTKGRIAAYIYNDSHDEDPETFEMVLFDASDGVSIADGVAVGTIVNDDPMPAAWLARFGRAVAEHALRDIADRIAAPRTAGVEGVLAGQALGGPTGAGSPAFAAPDRFNSRVDRRFDAGFGNSSPAGSEQVMSLRDFMLSSSFTATGAVDMTGGSMAFWGRASEGSFDGREGRVSLSGDTMTALLGADYARGPWLLGMALAESEGKSSYADTGTGAPDAAAFAVPAGVPGGLDALSVQAGSGEVEGRLTAVIPYLALEASEHVRLWSAMGQGSGTVTVTPALGGRYEAATSWTMMAAGLRGDLLAPGGSTGPALALTSDALWVRTSSEKTRDLAASESDVSRLRLGLEGSWAAALRGDASLTPKLELARAMTAAMRKPASAWNSAPGLPGWIRSSA